MSAATLRAMTTRESLLSFWRQQIDSIDRELVSLLIRRLMMSRSVAQAKRAWGLPVHDEKREWEMLERVDDELVRSIYALVIRRCREIGENDEPAATSRHEP